VPIIAKETGAGISRQQAILLRGAGVLGLDVGGAGGTSFALVEAVRAADRAMGAAARLGEMLGDWGLPTAVSVVECAGLGPTIVATGGVRSGLDAARALALGADAVGVARPMLTAALQGYDVLRDYVAEFIEGLRVVVFLTGARTISELHNRPRVVTGRTAEWLNALGASEKRGS
jgi:isopentenyl-diphosphate delta-isomerase